MITIPPSIFFSVPMFFTSEGDIDWGTLERYLEDCASSAGVEILYAMAYNTRYPQLTVEEILAVNRRVCAAAHRHGKRAIVGHPITLTTVQLRAFCETLAPLSPWAVSVLFPERYYGIAQPVMDYLSAPAAAGLSTFVHEMKLVSGFDGSLVDWPEALVRQAMELPHVVGIKEDSKHDPLSSMVIREFADRRAVVLAGGGKRRALRFLPEGLTMWLNGSLMLCPAPAARVHAAFTGGDQPFIDRYLAEVEAPFFDQVVKRHGWHVGHRAALQVAGYGGRYERGPMSVMGDDDFEIARPILENVVTALRGF